MSIVYTVTQKYGGCGMCERNPWKIINMLMFGSKNPVASEIISVCRVFVLYLFKRSLMLLRKGVLMMFVSMILEQKIFLMFLQLIMKT